jgi:hypothetical protein
MCHDMQSGMISRFAVLARSNSSVNADIFGRLNTTLSFNFKDASLHRAVLSVLRHILTVDVALLKLAGATDFPFLYTSLPNDHDLAALWRSRKLIDEQIEAMFRPEQANHTGPFGVDVARVSLVTIARMFNHQANHQWKLMVALDRQSQHSITAEQLEREATSCSERIG